jgi:hypothetical protein
MPWATRAKKRIKGFLGAPTLAAAPAANSVASNGVSGGTSGGGPEIRGSGNGRNVDSQQPDEHGANENFGNEDFLDKPPIQYRLEATRVAAPVTGWRRHVSRVLSCFGLFSASSYHQSQTGVTVGINPNQKLALYLHWMFRVNFIFLFMVMCIMFFALCVLFAGFIALAGNMDPQCIRIGSEYFGWANTGFADAFALSWTTFSTVGYGSTYTALGYQNENRTGCFFVSFICSLESLLGVLYSGYVIRTPTTLCRCCHC